MSGNKETNKTAASDIEIILYDPKHHEDFFKSNSYAAMMQNPGNKLTEAFFELCAQRELNSTKYNPDINSVLEHDYYINEALKSEIYSFSQDMQEKYYRSAFQALPNSPKAFFSLYHLLLKKHAHELISTDKSDYPDEIVNLTEVGILYGHLKEPNLLKIKAKTVPPLIKQ